MRVGVLCAYVFEGNSGDVDLCGCEAYAELNDFNYQTASIEQSQAVVFATRDSNPSSHIVLYVVSALFCFCVRAFLFCYLNEVHQAVN